MRWLLGLVIATGAAHDGVPARAKEAPTLTIQNLGLLAESVEGSERFVAFLVPENGADFLNGDDDKQDEVLHVYEPATGRLLNTQKAMVIDHHHVEDDRVLFPVGEAAETVDLNGDGDELDYVLHLLDLSDGSVSNLGVGTISTGFAYNYSPPTGPLWYRSGQIAAALDEVAQQQDLNGDGDALDVVLGHGPVGGGAGLRSLGAPGAAWARATPAVTYDRSIRFELTNDFLLLMVPELESGRDLNGDGDLDDEVAAVATHPWGPARNLGVSVFRVRAAGPLALLWVSEFDEGGLDLNGDGDANDRVAFVYHAGDSALQNLGLACELHVTTETLALVEVNEGGQGATDLNGDGDASDTVLHVYDLLSDTVTNLGLAEARSTVLGRIVAVAVDEQRQSVDLNGDGDKSDIVVHLHDVDTGVTTNLGLAGDRNDVFGPALPIRPPTAERYLFLSVSESGQGVDLNGDGDTTDSVAFVRDLETGVTTNTGVSVESLVYADGVALGQVQEADEGVDLNGDGDLLDLVYHVIDGPTATASNTGLAAAPWGPVLQPDYAAMIVDEAAMGAVDLDGNGETDDWVLFVVRWS